MAPFIRGCDHLLSEGLDVVEVDMSVSQSVDEVSRLEREREMMTSF